MMLRSEGTYRHGQPGGRGAFGVHLGGQRVGRASVTDLLHGKDRKVWGDGAYQGRGEVIRAASPHTQDMTCRRTKVQGLCGRASQAQKHD
jgi:hypothetical protein